MKCNLGLGRSFDEEGSTGDGRESGEVSNSGDRSGAKRSYDENGCELGWNEGEGTGKKIRGFQRADGLTEDGGDESIGIRVTGVEELGFLDERGDGACLNGNVDEEEVGVNSNLGNEILDEEFDQRGSGVAERRSEVVVISSDEVDDKNNVGTRDDKGKGKAIENGFSQEIIQARDLALGITDRHWAGNFSSSMVAERIYTSEEVKEIEELADLLISLRTDPRLIEEFPEGSYLTEPVGFQFYLVNEAAPRFDPRRYDEDARRSKEARRENAIKFRETAKDDASRLARPNSQPQEHHLEHLEKNHDLEDFPGPFSSALKALRKRNAKCSAQQMIEWQPLKEQNVKIMTPIASSLLDLSLRILAKNSVAIVSLENIPDWLRQRLTSILCDARKMNSHVLNLLLRDSPAEIRVKDCSWITEAQACRMFRKLDTKNLRVLQLDLFGQCPIEDILNKTVIRSSSCLMCLRIISLRGAYRLSDDLLKSLVRSAPLLQSVNIGQSSLLTCEGIQFLAAALASSLKELYIDDCHNIAALRIMISVGRFQHLEVLSVAGIESVCDLIVSFISMRCGGNMKELDVANCGRLTDRSLEAIGKHCPKLQSLNISNINRLTDFGLLYLANGCQSIQTLICCHNEFSDDAIAAFVEASGQSLKELSLKGISKVGPSTALSLAKYSRNLSSLDLSWCRGISNEALGLVVDSCLSLKLLKIFGCTQITEIFLRGHSNPLVHIIGTNLTPSLEHVNLLEPAGVLLRYSPLSDDDERLSESDGTD